LVVGGKGQRREGMEFFCPVGADGLVTEVTHSWQLCHTMGLPSAHEAFLWQKRQSLWCTELTS